MNDQPFDKIESRNCFGNGLIVFMACVMESDIFLIITVNAWRGNGRSSKITSDILDNRDGIHIIFRSMNVEPIWMGFVNETGEFGKHSTKALLHAIKQSFLEGFTEESIIKIEILSLFWVSVNLAAQENVDMWVPLQISAKCMQDTNKAGIKLFRRGSFVCNVGQSIWNGSI